MRLSPQPVTRNQLLARLVWLLCLQVSTAFAEPPEIVVYTRGERIPTCVAVILSELETGANQAVRNGIPVGPRAQNSSTARASPQAYSDLRGVNERILQRLTIESCVRNHLRDRGLHIQDLELNEIREMRNAGEAFDRLVSVLVRADLLEIDWNNGEGAYAASGAPGDDTKRTNPLSERHSGAYYDDQRGAYTVGGGELTRRGAGSAWRFVLLMVFAALLMASVFAGFVGVKMWRSRKRASDGPERERMARYRDEYEPAPTTTRGQAGSLDRRVDDLHVKVQNLLRRVPQVETEQRDIGTQLNRLERRVARLGTLDADVPASTPGARREHGGASPDVGLVRSSQDVVSDYSAAMSAGSLQEFRETYRPKFFKPAGGGMGDGTHVSGGSAEVLAEVEERDAWFWVIPAQETATGKMLVAPSRCSDTQSFAAEGGEVAETAYRGFFDVGVGPAVGALEMRIVKPAEVELLDRSAKLISKGEIMLYLD